MQASQIPTRRRDLLVNVFVARSLIPVFALPNHFFCDVGSVP